MPFHFGIESVGKKKKIQIKSTAVNAVQQQNMKMSRNVNTKQSIYKCRIL